MWTNDFSVTGYLPIFGDMLVVNSVETTIALQHCDQFMRLGIEEVVLLISSGKLLLHLFGAHL